MSAFPGIYLHGSGLTLTPKARNHQIQEIWIHRNREIAKKKLLLGTTKMVQGFKSKGGSGRPGMSMKKVQKAKKAQVKQAKYAKKGSSLKLPKNHNRDEALDDQLLSREIAKASEKKTAGKLLQNGSHLKMTDLTQKGKEVNREAKRLLLKKKVSRVEEKIKVIQAKQER